MVISSDLHSPPNGGFAAVAVTPSGESPICTVGTLAKRRFRLATRYRHPRSPPAETFGEWNRAKSVSDLYAPISRVGVTRSTASGRRPW